MRKILFSMLLFILTLSIVGCNQKNTESIKGKYTEYHLYQMCISDNCYYTIESTNQLDVFLNNFFQNESIKDIYNDSYFNDNSLIVFPVVENSGETIHQINTYGISDEGELVLDIVRLSAGMTCDMAYWVVFYELTNAEFSLLKGVTFRRNTSNFKLQSYEDYVTSLPTNMPDNFSIFVYGYLDESIAFDSTNGYLMYGYTSDSKKNETALMLSNEELNEIYQLFRNIAFDKYPKKLSIAHNNTLNDKSFISISLSGTDIRCSCWINSIDKLQIENWNTHSDLGNAITDFITKYIQSTEEFKSLEQNVAKSNFHYER